MKAVALTRYLPISDPRSFEDTELPTRWQKGATCSSPCMPWP